MALNEEQLRLLEEFLETSRYLTNGAVITDLDGTAVHEFNGSTIIHKDVEFGLKRVYDAGRPVVINTLRFPLSVIRTFGKEWYKISASSIPVVLLNGSQLGHITKTDSGFVFDQMAAFPMNEDEINNVITTIDRFSDVMKDLILFYYPQDWTAGEIIWTSEKGKIPFLQNKYQSASAVISTPPEALPEILLQSPVCMILLLIDAPNDKLMAYQHTKRNNFFTHDKVDKLTGSEQIAKHLGFELADSVGAGDSTMDVFLAGTGLGLHIRNKELPFKAKISTIQLEDFHDFGSLLQQLSQLQKVLS